MTKPLVTFLLVLVLLVPACVADDLINPDRPGIADGSESVSRGRFQIELGIDRSHDSRAGTEDRSIETPLLLRYGFTDHLEGRLETRGFQRTRTSDATGSVATTAFNPIALGVKYHVVDRKDRKPSIGVIGRLTPPSGSGDARSDKTTADVRLAADMDLTPRWAINPNLGVASYVDSNSRRFIAALAALTVQYNFSEKANVFVDGGLQTPEDHSGGSSLQLDGGGAWIIGRDTQLDFSVTRRAHGSAPNMIWSFGISRRM